MQFPPVIDNTMRKDFVSCPQLFMRKYCQNLRSNSASVDDLHFGGAFAAGLEHARKCFYEYSCTAQWAIEHGIDAAVAYYGDYRPPPKAYKNVYSLQRALQYYFEQWPLTLADDALIPVEGGIECSFAVELPFKHPNSGQPLYYAGRYDMCATDKNGRYYAVDEKTTKNISSGWMNQWDLDSQMTGYIWSILQKYGDVEAMAQIRAVGIQQYDCSHVELPITRSKWMIEEWYATLMHDVARMIGYYSAGLFPKALNSNACAPYTRACEMAMLCMSESPEQRMDQYHVKIWNPTVKGG